MGQTPLHAAFWGKAGHQMASERRSRKDGCHTPFNFHRFQSSFQKFVPECVSEVGVFVEDLRDFYCDLMR